MKNWLKVVLRIAAIVTIFLGAIAIYSYHLAHGRPAWFAREILTPEETSAAAQRAFQKSAETISYAADITAAQGRRRISSPAKTLPSVSIAPKTITLSQRELDSFLTTFASSPTSAVSAKFAQYVEDPRVVFVDSRLEIIGTLKNSGIADGTAVSLGLVPSIDANGQFWLKLTDIYGGRLPLPRSFFATQEQKIHQTLLNDLPTWQENAQMLPNGTVNGGALQAQLGKLCLACLDNTPTSPVFLIRSAIDDNHHFVPVRVTDVKIAEQAISITIQPLSNEELDQVVPELQKAYGGSSPPSASSGE